MAINLMMMMLIGGKKGHLQFLNQEKKREENMSNPAQLQIMIIVMIIRQHCLFALFSCDGQHSAVFEQFEQQINTKMSDTLKHLTAYALDRKHVLCKNKYIYNVILKFDYVWREESGCVT